MSGVILVAFAVGLDNFSVGLGIGCPGPTGVSVSALPCNQYCGAILTSTILASFTELKTAVSMAVTIAVFALRRPRGQPPG